MTDQATSPAPSAEAFPEVVQSSYSALTLHRKCAMAWYYTYVKRLERIEVDSQPERDFGSWWSSLRAVEALERGRALDSLRATPRVMGTIDNGPEFDQRTVTTEDVFEAADAWWKGRSGDEMDEWKARLGGGLPNRLREVFTRWLDEWAQERRTERPIGVEVRWERSLPRPASDLAWDASEGLPDMRLIGYIDEVYEDYRRGMVVVRDHKTSKQLSAQTAADDMMDSQLQLFAWGLSPLLAEWGCKPVRATAYDRACSQAPATPVLTASGALSKSVTRYDLATYLSWAAGEDGEGIPWGQADTYFVSGPRKGLPKFGRYTAEESVIDRLSSPAARSAWFQRTLVPLSSYVVKSHLRAAVDTATDIWRTRRRAEASGEAARSLSRANCTWCDFASLCRAQMVGGADGEYPVAEFGLRAKDGRDYA